MRIGLRALKTKITFNLALLLLLAMFSIDLVTMVTAQRNLVRSEVSKGRAVSHLLATYLSEHPGWGDLSSVSEVSTKVRHTLREAGASCFILLDHSRQRISLGDSRCAHEKIIADLAEKAMSFGEERVQFIGSTFGFFWMQHEYLVIAVPLHRDGSSSAGFSLVFALDGIYRSLRSSQQILLVYIFVNAAILVVLGVYRVSKLYLLPLARLAQRAEDYKEEDTLLFSVRKEDNELQRLSLSLNGLLRRLSAEKAKLRDTVASLEAANADLQRAQTEIVRAEKLATVGRLSAGIAHEIGNPISIVTGYLELMKHAEIKEEERIEFLDRAQEEIERISVIIRQLLEVARPSSGRSQMVAVHALIADMTEGLILQPFMSRMRIKTALQAQYDTVKADSNQLRQVFLNLVINAADAFSAKGAGSSGELMITTENGPDVEGSSGGARNWLHIHFRDAGAGILPENMECIFDPFFTTKEPGKGTGLGLAVSLMIIAGFGGTLRAESTAGEGTVMTVSLPDPEPSGGQDD